MRFTPRTRRGLFALVAALVVVLFVGTVAPSMIQLLPQWGANGQLDPSQLAPDQVWGSADGQRHETGEGTVNRAMPVSESSKYPQYKPKDAPAGATNVAREVAAPNTFTGFDPAKSKEDASKRGTNSRTFVNPDGTETTELSQSAENYRAADGSYQPIDTTLVPEGDGWRNKADSVRTRLSGTAAEEPFVSMKLAGGEEMSYGLAGTAAVRGQASGSTIVYPGVSPHTDLRLDVMPGGVKETMVLANGQASNTWLFPLRLNGLRAKIQDGNVVLSDDRGDVKAQIPAGHMVDAAGVRSDAVAYEITRHNGAPALKLTADQGWLRDGARRYPVAVDPSVSEQTSGLSMYNNGTTARSGDEMHVGNGWTGYLKFDGVRSALRDHRVFAAQLSLANFYAEPSCRPEPITVHEVLQSWGSGTAARLSTGAQMSRTAFAHGHVEFGQSQSACPTANEVIDLGEHGRNVVQAWARGTTNNGLAVKAVSGFKKFVGHAAAQNKPKLYVTHTPYDASYKIERGVPEPPVHGGSAGYVQIAVTNNGSQTWSKAAGYKLAYRAFRTDGSPVASVTSNDEMPEVGPGQTVSLKAKIEALRAGDYLLDFSVVHNNTYFTDEQIPPARLSLSVINIPPFITGLYPPAGHNVPTLMPQLWAKAIDVDPLPGVPVGVGYEFEICSSRADGTPDHPNGCRRSPRVNTQTWTVPAGWLQWSETYHWRPWAYDSEGQANNPPLPFSALLTSVPQPDITSHLGGAPYSAGDLDFDPQIGNYSTGAVDASVSVAGPELTIARTYNSLDPRKHNLFGAGWSTRFDTRVIKDLDQSGNVVVTYPDGQQVRFGKNAEPGSFDPPPGRQATFYQEIGNGSKYKLVDKSNTVYTFREFDGRLIGIVDNAGREVELTYGLGGQIDQAISKASGRTLTFEWEGAHVKRVKTEAPSTGAAQIVWTYEYTGDQLTKVCDPHTKCTNYGYTTGSHYRSMVLDSKPYSYWRLGEPSGEHAVSQVQTNLNRDWGKHRDVTLGRPGPLEDSPDTAVSFNGTTSRVELPRAAVMKNRDLSIEMWFKTTSGGPLIGFQHKKYEETQDGAVPVLYVDRDGKLRGQFWHGRVAPITTTAKVNDGQWHHVVLTGSVNVQKMFVDGRYVNETLGEIDDSRLEFGQIGAGFAVGPADWEPAGWWPGEAKKHFQGEIDEVALYHYPLGQEAVSGHFNGRTRADLLKSVTMPSERVAAEIEYDNVNDRIKQYTDENGGTWKLGLPTVSSTEKPVDQEGATKDTSIVNMVKTIGVTDPGGRPHYFDYDPVKGRIIRFAAPLGVDVRHEDRADPSIITTVPTSAPPCSGTPATNPDGTPAYCGGTGSGGSQWTGGPVQGVGARTYEYDATGFQHRIVDENGSVVELTHDTRGNVVKRKTCQDPSACNTEHFTYQPFTPGNETNPKIDKQLTARDGRSAGPDDTRFLTTSAYDDLGNLTSQTMPDGKSVTHTYTDENTAPVPRPGQTTTKPTPPKGLLQSTKDARGQRTEYRYHDNGDLYEKKEPNGLITRYAYDNLGRTTSEKEISSAFPLGLETRTVYDGANRPVEVTDAAVTNAVTGKKHTKFTKTTYNADGQPSEIVVSDLTGGDASRTISYSYDDRGRQDSVTDGEGNRTSYGYDNFGNRTFVVDALGTKIEYAYTARNKVAEVRMRGWHGKAVSGGVQQDDEEPDAGRLLVMEANTYDLGGRLVRRVDAMGRKTLYEYYGNGLVFRVFAEVTGADGKPRKIELESNKYDGAGNVVERKSAGGKVVTYKFDNAGRIEESLADPAGLQRRVGYKYDENGNVKEVTRSGKGSNTPGIITDTSDVVTFDYDNEGNQIAETVQNGTLSRKTSRTYDQRGLKISETDPRGNATGADPVEFTTNFTYDEAERQVAVEQPSVKVESDGGDPVVRRPKSFIGFNTFGDQTQSKDENGHVVTSAFDKAARLVRTETPDYVAPGSTTPIKGVIERRYDAVGNAVEVKDPRGAVSRFRYDQRGRMVERQDPKADAPTEIGGVWKYTYTHNDEQLSVTDPTGARTEATYDELGRKKTESVLERKPVSAAFTTVFEHNDAGELKKITSPAPAADVTTFTYDTLGQRTSGTDAANVTTQSGYDGAGRPVWQRDALGRTSYLRYDQTGSMTGQFSLDGQSRVLRNTVMTHDFAGNVKSVTDAMGRKAEYSYDALGRLIQQKEPVSDADADSITTSFGYDAAGQRTRYTDGRGNNFVTTYNSWALPEKVIEPSTTAHPALADRTWTNTYDQAGSSKKMTAPGNVTRERSYDALGRLTTETGAGAASATTTRAQAYDLSGRLKELDAPGGRNTYDYNDRGGLLSASGPSGASSFEYDEQGRVKTRTDAAGTARFTYDKGRLHTMTDGVTGVGQIVSYNAAGQLSKIQYGSVRSRTVDYDGLGRQKLDELRTAAGAVESSAVYEYDNNDRLRRKAVTGLAGAGEHTYTYDYANRLKSWTFGGATTAYSWDKSGNRTQNGAKTAAYDERNRLRSDGDYTYKYSARGTMDSRTSSGMEEKFSFDAFDRMVAVGTTSYAYDGADRMVSRNTKSFAYAGFDIDPVSDDKAVYGRGASGELMSISEGGAKRLALSDKHGDLVGGFDPTATSGVADSAAYDPFGVPTASAGAQRQLGYQGDWTDPDTKQVNMGARWYQPGTGGFASRDSVTASSGPSVLFNRYTYGAGRPTDMIDPDGHWPDWGQVWNGVKTVAKAGLEVVKEVSGYNDVANFIREPSWANAFWAASNFIPGGKLLKGAKYLYKYGDDVLGAARKYGDDVVGGARRYGDDVVGGARKFGDDLAAAGRRVGDFAKSALKEAAQLAAKKAAAEAAARAARIAAMAAITKRAKAAIAHAAKNNPLPVLAAALRPRIQMKDLVSSSANLPARKVGALAENVQDVNKTIDIIKATIVKPGTDVIKAVGEQAVSDLANSAVPGAGDFLALLGGGKKRGNSAAKDAGHKSRGESSTGSPCLDPNSFDGSTTVLMADGSRKPIASLKVGDVVRATDPTTGASGAKAVTDVRSHEADGRLYEITVLTSSGVAKIVSTDGHPFWVSSLGEWRKAQELKFGYRFTTADGRPATVLGTRSFSKVQLVYNLTVDGTHTYYVGAAGRGQSAAADVLTHNCGNGIDGEGWAPEGYMKDEVASRRAGLTDRKDFWTERASDLPNGLVQKDVPREIRDLVSDYKADPNMRPRQAKDENGNWGDDLLRGTELSRSKRDHWQGAPIYYNGDETSQARIAVHPATNEIVWFGLYPKGHQKAGGHNYGNMNRYPWR
ncbi:LamG-like jellyroll fold domain-containing protein [Lentzea sp. NPDC055074]